MDRVGVPIVALHYHPSAHPSAITKLCRGLLVPDQTRDNLRQAIGEAQPAPPER
jgi:hypothetical protein